MFFIMISKDNDFSLVFIVKRHESFVQY